jgi:hypothetical protein
MSNLAADQLAASRLFSSSVVRELARKGRSPLFARLAEQSCLLRSLSGSQHVYDVFDAAFAMLKQDGYRHEYIYKSALTHKILLGKHSLQTASMLSEFRVGPCKADVAILNGTATVYEVKSERDSLSRLERQVAAYATVFASIYVIAGGNHINAVISAVPHHVGVLRLENRYRISTVRDATSRPERTSPAAIFDSIRTLEAKMILRSCGADVPDVPNTELNAALRRLFVKLSAREAHEGMVQVLRKTRNLQPLSKLVGELPLSLQTAALSVPLRKLDHARLVAAVNTPLREATGWA